MNKISDNDLVLLYYGEHDDPALARQVANDPELRQRMEALSRELEPLDRLPVPDPGDEFEARIWQRIVPRLAEGTAPAPSTSWLHSLLRPRFSLAGIFALVMVAGLAFWMGRETTVPVPGIEPTINAERLLAMRMGEHLAEADVLLTQVANNGAGNQSRISEWAAGMLISNRIYRRAAEASGDQRLAQLLLEIEPLLIELANQPHRTGTVDESLLFRVRVQARQYRGSQTPI